MFRVTCSSSRRFPVCSASQSSTSRMFPVCSVPHVPLVAVFLYVPCLNVPLVADFFYSPYLSVDSHYTLLYGLLLTKYQSFFYSEVKSRRTKMKSELNYST